MWALDRLLSGLVRQGSLDVTGPDGRLRRYGAGSPRVAIALSGARTPAQIARDPALAAGEAFMAGRLVITEGDAWELVHLIAANAQTLGSSRAARLLNRTARLVSLVQERNPLARARANARAHYDLPDALYEALLDPHRQYSCAYWARPGMTLEEAQLAKMRLIAAKLRLEPGMRVLDIGCGWGGLARHLARSHGVHVTGVTVSPSQLVWARQRSAVEGLAGATDFQPHDWRELPGRFDRIVSVGMFEHVGRPQYADFFAKLRDLLAPGGVALLHTIGRPMGPGATDAFTRRHIFPGGYAPAVSEVLPHIERSGLWLCDLDTWRLHYALTLRAWWERTMAARERLEPLLGGERFRMWQWYLAGAAAAFRHGGLAVHQYLMATDRNVLPLTRDWMLEGWSGSEPGLDDRHLDRPTQRHQLSHEAMDADAGRG